MPAKEPFWGAKESQFQTRRVHSGLCPQFWKTKRLQGLANEFIVLKVESITFGRIER